MCLLALEGKAEHHQAAVESGEAKQSPARRVNGMQADSDEGSDTDNRQSMAHCFDGRRRNRSGLALGGDECASADYQCRCGDGVGGWKILILLPEQTLVLG